MSTSKPTSSSDDFRRKWDSEQYQELADKRLQQEYDKNESHTEKPVQREMLKARSYRIDLDSRLGKSVVISKTTPASESGGYYCNVCDCVVKDSINFLDHVNGKKHQRNLGMSMKVERSTLDQVQKRFELNKKKMDEKKKQYDFEERMKELKEDEERLKVHRRERRKERKRKANEEEPVDNDISALMGFGGFGSSKKR